MSRRKIEDRNIRSLTKLAGGSSYAVTIPIEIIRELGWQSKQKLEVKKYGNGVIIRDWEPEK